MPDSRTRDHDSAESTHVGSTTGQETIDVGAASEGGDRLNLLIIGERLILTKSLPSAGEVTLGRSSECDLVIDDPSVSRSHAQIAIGPPLVLRDLGSANGTRVGEHDLPAGDSAEVAPGDVLRLGNTTVVVQRRAAARRAQRIWGHDYFEARVEEECSRAERAGGHFALARFHCRPAPKPEVLQDALARAARKSDVVGEYSPSELEVLFVDTPPEEARQAADRLGGQLAESRIDARVGLACFPADGRSSHELLAGASPLSREADGDGSAASEAIVADRRMRELYRLADRIAAGHLPVLILGETGVGKEVLAERIHRSSPRAEKPYLRLNCAALSETLLESELFGHEKGAFTGAAGAKPGLLETANGGSVFLDEIGELPYGLQVKLLRVLEEGSVLRVGGLKPRTLDVRFIAATNRDLEAEIARGTFRQDLYYRLNGATLIIPPLRERAREIPSLAEAFAAEAARQISLAEPPALSPPALSVLERYSWPGNIRELKNAIERAVLLGGAGPLLPEHLPLEKMQSERAFGAADDGARALSSPPAKGAEGASAGRATRPRAETAAALGAPAAEPGAPAAALGAPAAEPGAPAAGPASEADTAVYEIPPPEGSGPRAGGAPEDDERERILEALAETMWNQTAAAKRLGIARRTLIKKLERYGISGPRKKR